MTTRTLRRVGTIAAAAALLAPALAATTAAAAPASPATPVPVCTSGTCTLRAFAVGRPQKWTVPPGVTSITAKVAAASGGSTTDADHTEYAGKGGIVIARVPVTPGQVLTIVAGAKGDDASFPGYGGGATDGLSDGSPGGGGSYLFRGTAPLVVAGGGGGAAVYYDFESGTTNFDVGGTGSDGRGSGAGTDGGGGGGTGATRSAPGCDPGNCSATRGTGKAKGPDGFGRGGAAAGGGGGGGGFYGGGGGNALGGDGEELEFGGGGGSSFLAPGVVETGHGHQLGNGYVTLSWAAPAT